MWLPAETATKDTRCRGPAGREEGGPWGWGRKGGRGPMGVGQGRRKGVVGVGQGGRKGARGVGQGRRKGPWGGEEIKEGSRVTKI